MLSFRRFESALEDSGGYQKAKYLVPVCTNADWNADWFSSDPDWIHSFLYHEGYATFLERPVSANADHICNSCNSGDGRNDYM